MASTNYAQLLSEANRRAAELDILNRINRALTSTLNYEEVLILILQEVNGILGVEAASVSLVDEAARELVFEYAVGDGAAAVRGLRLPLGCGVVGWVVEHGEPALVADTRADPRFYEEVDRRSGFQSRSILCAPLKKGDRVIGAIEALNKLEGSFTENDLRLLIGVADQAAVAIENARLYQQVKRQTEELAARNQELIDTRDRLIRAERIAALGQIGLALRHEINNPLTAILARVDLILEEHPDLTPDVRRDIEVISEMAERIGRVVSGLENLQDRTTIYLGDIEMIDISPNKAPNPDAGQ